MKEEEVHNWSRHYDNLLWTVTTILITALAGLLAYSYTKETFDPISSLLGLSFTLLPVYFAKSFRSLRSNLHKILDDETKKLVIGGKFKQWPIYVSVFILIEILWIFLFWRHKSELTTCYFLWGIIVIAITIILACWSEE